MRTMRWTLASIGLLLIASGTSIVACGSNAENCEKTDTCGQVSTGTGTGGANDGSACVPGPNTDPGDECGTFVSESSGDDVNPGSKLSPVQTFAKAIEVASASGGTKRIYACAEEFPEAIEVPAGIEIYGGLDCESSWKYTGETAKTTLKPEPDKVPLTLKGGEGKTVIADVVALASDATLPGGSSIAAIADGATVDFMRCELSAGNGMAGDKGATPADPVGPIDPSDPAIAGTAGTAAGLTMGMAENPGGAGTKNTTCEETVGGNGGAGTEASGMSGTAGSPAGDIGKGGVGQPASGTWSCGAVGNGQAGDNGVDGTPGNGGAGMGTISATGYVGAAGDPGSPGTPGQGGGGGGGAKGKAGYNGASGGGGGAGGCGGKGGLGGMGGGSSIALISLDATLFFTNVTLNAGSGGKGGEGADGQSGGVGGAGGFGGLGAAGTSKACSGGEGGSGGLGGKGGGGRGGHSLGIAFTGTAPTTAGATITPGTVGEGGLGTEMMPDTQGQPGVKGETQAFEM